MTSDLESVLRGDSAWQAERPRTANSLAALLRNRIALGGFPPGSKLPTERELAAALGVGRNTVREAVRLLAADGLVSTTLGRSGGTWVQQSAAPDRAVRRGIAKSFHRTIHEYMEYRSAIEPLAARLAAERATPGDRRKLGRLLREPATDLAGYHRLDSQLHMTIARAGRNTVLYEAVARAREEMFVRGNVLWLQSNWSSVYPGGESAQDAFRSEHADLVRAIELRDPEAAEVSMRLHLAEARRQFLRILDAVAATG